MTEHSSDMKPTSLLLSPTKATSEVTPGKVKRLALISSEDLVTPTIAIPTIAVAAGSLATWGAIIYYGAHKRKISSVLAFPIMTFACFASFTPIHDGTHYSIAKGPYKKLVNQLVGNISGIPLNIPFPVYRQLHLMHHRYTNTENDPDLWDSQGPMVARCFKWFFPDYFWIKAVLTGHVKDAKIFKAAVFYLSMVLMMAAMHKKGMAYVKYWLLPQRFAYWFLAWLFAYVPHRPDGDQKFSATENIYKMTSVTGGIMRSDGLNLAIPLLNQHLHNIHHLYPHLPFTHYGHIWAKHKDALIAAGTEVHPIYSSKHGWHWDENLDGSKKI
ncbi:hypothetical protein BGZ76_003330 [Entomortierella beljakovae]|nr:hypothetical protein BGZ76_003330 [Entomortierella beljakovae]